ncbi:SRPBCC family protein [Pseudoduganella sp.]|uniref:SRPBCC family protein n=1 Tax=Pseudoduganella sp. TaxID=1880898 RepID=UPI0035B0A50E
MSDTDRVERSIMINAPRERVWRALASAEEFGAWFGADLAGQKFAPGQRVRGQFTNPDCSQYAFDAVIETMEAPRLMSYRWVPYPIDPPADLENDEPTLVTFTLQDAPGNATLLTVVESGFDKLPAQRRAKAFQMHTQGWEVQLENIKRHASK